MIRQLLWCACLLLAVSLWAQQDNSSKAAAQDNANSAPSSQKPASSQTDKSPQSKSSESSAPSGAPAQNSSYKFDPPRSDRVNADELPPAAGESSSKDTQIDLSPPDDDDKAHPRSGEAVSGAESEMPGGSDVGEFRPWNPHKSAKDVEVGDFYFKRKNYRAAEDRYREALYYKNNDADATYRLAVCLEKLNRPDEAMTEYQNYLKILPHGPQSNDAQKAIERMKLALSSGPEHK